MTESVTVSPTFVSYTLKIKEGASVLGAELTESVPVRPLESGFYVTFIIPIRMHQPVPSKSDHISGMRWPYNTTLHIGKQSYFWWKVEGLDASRLLCTRTDTWLEWRTRQVTAVTAIAACRSQEGSGWCLPMRSWTLRSRVFPRLGKSQQLQ